MRQFQFKVLAVNGARVRNADSDEFRQVNALSSEGWHIVDVREDPQHNRDLLFFLEREKDGPAQEPVSPDGVAAAQGLSTADASAMVSTPHRHPVLNGVPTRALKVVRTTVARIGGRLAQANQE